MKSEYIGINIKYRLEFVDTTVDYKLSTIN
jgi:hypothetical protein